MGDEKSKQSGHKHLRPQWAGKDITEQDHAQDLDREAALHEFDGKLPRHEAEGKAYDAYKKTQHAKAAAHHLRGIRLAEAAGDHREGRKHGLMYQLHLQALGHEPIGPVPNEVQQHAKGEDGGEGSSKVYSFKAHRGDIFVLPEMSKNEENTMANEIDTPTTLEWEFHDDNSGGFYSAFDKSERVLYRTWTVERGAKPAQHVLVRQDGVKQTPLGYFDARDKAFAKAEGTVATLRKNAAHGGGIPLGVPATAKAETGLGTIRQAMGKAGNEGIAAIAAAQRVGGKEASDAMGSSGDSYGSASSVSKGSLSASGSSSSASSMGKEESTTASHSAGEASSTASHSASSEIKPPWLKTETAPVFEAKSEGVRCGKCGASAAKCDCGNLGKAELCKKCGKAMSKCGGSCGMTKTEAVTVIVDAEKAEHERRYALGQELLAKVEQSGTGPTTTFGLDENGNPVGTSPAVLQDRLHNLYVAARFILDSQK